MKLLLSCGFGDWIATETFLTEIEKSRVTEIYWATRARDWIRESIDLTNVFPNLKDETTLYEDWGNNPHNRVLDLEKGLKPYCIGPPRDLITKLQLPVSQQLMRELTDELCTMPVLKSLHTRRYHESSYIKHTVADINKFNLPTNYAVIHAHSDNDLVTPRAFTDHDWLLVIEYLKRHNIPGVVINKSQTRPPEHDALIDLTNLTTVNEGLEIVKNAEKFIGCTSCFSVLAAKCVTENNIFLKGPPHLVNQDSAPFPTLRFYYSPLQGTDFITTDFTEQFFDR